MDWKEREGVEILYYPDGRPLSVSITPRFRWTPDLEETPETLEVKIQRFLSGAEQGDEQ